MPGQPQEIERFAEAMYDWSDWWLRHFCFECQPCWPCGPEFMGKIERIRESAAVLVGEEFQRNVAQNRSRASGELGGSFGGNIGGNIGGTASR